jgi:hypothetical protein
VDLLDRYIEVGAELKRTTIYRNYRNDIVRMIKNKYSYDDIVIWLKSEIKNRGVKLDKEITKSSFYQWIRNNVSKDEIEEFNEVEVAVAKKVTDKKVSVFKNLIK